MLFDISIKNIEILDHRQDFLGRTGILERHYGISAITYQPSAIRPQTSDIILALTLHHASGPTAEQKDNCKIAKWPSSTS